MGIPNLYPFKKQLIEDMERKKESANTNDTIKRLKHKQKVPDNFDMMVSEAHEKVAKFEEDQLKEHGDLDLDMDYNKSSILFN